MNYDTIHNITRKNQRAFEQKPQGAQLEDKKIILGSRASRLPEDRLYDFAYDYGSSKPHAATIIGAGRSSMT